MKNQFLGIVLKNIAVPGLVLALFVYLSGLTLLQEYVHRHAFLLMGLFSLASLFTLFLNYRAITGPDEKSVSRMIFVNVLRIIVIFGLAATFILAGVEEQRLFIFNFLILYLFFLVFEINAVISKLRRNLNRGD
ncbi:hypothetical protein AB9P05_08110 [Roseivirga sp. BDSF3-8]|uniref:hypothetical protein n=1 Tax=Roseivirga sp. BDSF3-8 TaxID=3241598 RepID=UPI003531C483